MQVIIGRFRFEFENWTQPGSFARAWFIGTTRRDIWIECKPRGDREPTAKDKAWEIVRSGRDTNYYLGRLTISVSRVPDRRAEMPIADSAESVGEPVAALATHTPSSHRGLQRVSTAFLRAVPIAAACGRWAATLAGKTLFQSGEVR